MAVEAKIAKMLEGVSAATLEASVPLLDPKLATAATLVRGYGAE